ncbi:MAG: DKNYY domain-containing protein [Pseudomonas sp.]|uniref:DKNYY domain-containing protein n=1 Tax=Pseudomonas sp. TaxID=306 RepID=UPI00339099CD
MDGRQVLPRLARWLSLVVGFSLLLGGCGPGRLVDGRISSSYFIDGGRISYAAGGNWLALGMQPLVGVEVGSFRPLAEHYGRDRQRVYYAAARLEQADPEGFQIRHAGFAFAVDGGHVYRQAQRIVELDAGSARLVGRHYMVDAHGAWYGEFPEGEPYLLRRLPEADPAQLALVAPQRTPYLATDRRHLYFMGERLPIQPAADLAVLALPLDSLVLRNDGDLYTLGYAPRQANPLAAHFKVQRKDLGGGNALIHYPGLRQIEGNGFWALLNQHLLVSQERFYWVPVKTTVGALRFFAEGPRHVLADGHLYYLPPGPAGTHALDLGAGHAVRVLDWHYSISDGHVRWRERTVDGAQAGSFSVFADGRPHQGIDAWDGRQFYFQGHAVAPFDAAWLGVLKGSE